MNSRASLLLATVLITVTGLQSPLHADDDVAAALKRAKQRVLAESYTLQYKYQDGESIRYKVEHVATVETRIQGNSQTTESRAVSTKLWNILETAPNRIKFQHSIADAAMWSQVSGRQPEEFDSKKDEEPPKIYKNVASTVGKPLSVVTMDPSGKIIQREDQVAQFNLGSGGITMPLPTEPIKVGQTWAQPYDMRVKKKDQTHMKVKTRKLYKLEKVQTGVATISVQTQVLTPINDPHIEAQLIQRLSNGEIKFDIPSGRMISKTMKWKENVVGFNGAQSNMKYEARFTEQLLDDAVAAQPAKAKQR